MCPIILTEVGAWTFGEPSAVRRSDTSPGGTCWYAGTLLVRWYTLARWYAGTPWPAPGMPSLLVRNGLNHRRVAIFGE
jgi:hypothetical protein